MQNGSKFGAVVWFTGLPSAGKTTISSALKTSLVEAGWDTELLDGDEIRKGLCRDLGFSREDREENLRRIAFVAELLARHGVLVLVAAISPYRNLRQEIRRQSARFIEVYVNASLATCEHRDVKGLYRKARAGEIQRLTGIDDVYEPPLEPEVECRTDTETLDQSVQKVLSYIMAQSQDEKNTVPANGAKETSTRRRLASGQPRRSSW